MQTARFSIVGDCMATFSRSVTVVRAPNVTHFVVELAVKRGVNCVLEFHFLFVQCLIT
jgi:hypothetical protein